MSKRRTIGEWVWLSRNSGFVGESNRLKAEIINLDPEWEKHGLNDPCMLGCDQDEECREWPNLLTEPDPENHGSQYNLCHVSECQMHDEKQN